METSMGVMAVALLVIVLLFLWMMSAQRRAAKARLEELRHRNAKLNAQLNKVTADLPKVDWPKSPAARAADEISRLFSFDFDDRMLNDLAEIIEKHHS